jgi:hypothetical protein
MLSALRRYLPILAFAWILPGGGHFLLKRNGRGGLLAAAVSLAFLAGLLMRGPLFTWLWSPRDMLASLIQCGGFLAQLLAGLPFFFAVWFGYEQADIPGLTHDYGAKFLVVAGLLNVLAMVDAYEIARGDKN